jgi:hypothetical protein
MTTEEGEPSPSPLHLLNEPDESPSDSRHHLPKSQEKHSVVLNDDDDESDKRSSTIMRRMMKNMVVMEDNL